MVSSLILEILPQSEEATGVMIADPTTDDITSSGQREVSELMVDIIDAAVATAGLPNSQPLSCQDINAPVGLGVAPTGGEVDQCPPPGLEQAPSERLSPKIKEEDLTETNDNIFREKSLPVAIEAPEAVEDGAESDVATSQPGPGSSAVLAPSTNFETNQQSRLPRAEADHRRVKFSIRNSSTQLYFTSRTSRPLRNACAHFCQKAGVSSGIFRWTFEGVRIHEHETPQSVSLLHPKASSEHC